jgi:hypothetical protein
MESKLVAAASADWKSCENEGKSIDISNLLVSTKNVYPVYVVFFGGDCFS